MSVHISLGRFWNFLSGARVSEDAPPPYLLGIRSSKIFILATICTAVFTDIFLYGIVVPVIPFALSVRAGVATQDVQHWVSVLLAVYGAGLLVASPVFGWYADRSSSRRWPLLLGLFALTGSTVMLCLARSIAVFVAGRLLQGIAAAVVWTVGTALLVDTVGQRDVGQLLGYVGVSMSLGILLAPLLGGLVYRNAGYFAVFYMAFGLLFLDILLRLALIEKKIAVQWAVPKVQTTVQGKSRNGATGVVEPLALPAHPLETTGDRGYVERTTMEQPAATKYPPIITLLASRRLLVALWGCLVQAALVTAFDGVLPIFVKETFDWDSDGAGLVFLAVMIPNFIAPFVGALSDRYGPRWLTVFGFVCMLPFWILLRFVTHNTLQQKVLLCALLALIGLCLATVMPPLMAEVTYIVEAKEKKSPGRFGVGGALGSAYGLYVTAFAAGTLIGPIWAGFVKTHAGWGTMSWTLGLFSIAGAIPSLIWTGGLITRKNPKTGDERAQSSTTTTDAEMVV